MKKENFHIYGQEKNFGSQYNVLVKRMDSWVITLGSNSIYV